MNNSPIDAPEVKRTSGFKKAVQFIFNLVQTPAALPFAIFAMYMVTPLLRQLADVDKYFCALMAALWYIAYAIRDSRGERITFNGDVFLTKKDPNEPIKKS